jgi:hypothetical protein
MFGAYRKKQYKAQLIGRSQIVYQEDDRTLHIDTELAIDGLIVYLGKVTGWNPPHNSDPFGEEDIGRIAANIQDRFTTKSERVYIVE